MFKKHLLVLSFILFVIVWKYIISNVFVYAEKTEKLLEEQDVNYKINLVYKSNENIYLDSNNLKTSTIIFKSKNDLSNFKLSSNCNVFSNTAQKKWDYYVFNIKYLKNECKDYRIILINNLWYVWYNFRLNFIKKIDLYKRFIDYSDKDLKHISMYYYNKIKSIKKYNRFNFKIEKNYYKYLIKNKLLKEYMYNFQLIKDILIKRKSKYQIPVANTILPTKSNKLPNSQRPYRSKYTDWLHHWIDIDTALWSNLYALDDAIVIRVVRDWRWQDFTKLKYQNLSIEDKANNLDILRWNQVWLKTMKWEVVFYSHFDKIYKNITEGILVKKWQVLWNIWVSGIPDKKYDDYHLHFTIMQNKYLKEKAWQYKNNDYLYWDWKFKWESLEYILDNTYNIFDKS